MCVKTPAPIVLYVRVKTHFIWDVSELPLNALWDSRRHKIDQQRNKGKGRKLKDFYSMQIRVEFAWKLCRNLLQNGQNWEIDVLEVTFTCCG